MLRRWVEPFTRSVGRLVDPAAGYSRRKRKVKPVAGLHPSFSASRTGTEYDWHATSTLKQTRLRSRHFAQVCFIHGGASENAIKSAETCSLLCNKLRARGTAAVELTPSLASVGVRCPALCHVDYGHKIDSLTLLSR